MFLWFEYFESSLILFPVSDYDNESETMENKKLYTSVLVKGGRYLPGSSGNTYYYSLSLW